MEAPMPLEAPVSLEEPQDHATIMPKKMTPRKKLASKVKKKSPTKK
jgi:hypothetical protein